MSMKFTWGNTCAPDYKRLKQEQEDSGYWSSISIVMHYIQRKIIKQRALCGFKFEEQLSEIALLGNSNIKDKEE